MADRTSAEIFGMIFDFLADDGPVDRYELARYLWSQTFNYDFDHYQMDCDGALEELGLARLCSCGSYYYWGDGKWDMRWHEDCETEEEG